MKRKFEVFGHVTGLAAAIMIFAAPGIANAADDAKTMDQPINCATAEGDLRVIESEKQHVKKQAVSGIFAITPAGFLLNAIAGATDKDGKAKHDDYNAHLDARAAAIKQKRNLN
ncbi:MAG: hypothetical protein O2967_06640 [Proteobacteria bacterium]|nr:hypothetical protein [Pseudomonadota bacterium]